MTHGNGRFFAVVGSNKVMSSKDGETWVTMEGELVDAEENYEIIVVVISNKETYWQALIESSW